jgi:hypothetical protein
VIPAGVRELAETPDRYTRLTPARVDRIDTGRFVMLRGPSWAAVSGVRVGGDGVAELVRETRDLAGPRSPIWWIGPSTEPRDLHERLRALGLRTPADRVDELVSMATVQGPQAPPVETVRVETLEDYLASLEIRWEAFGTPPERRDDERDRAEEDLAAMVGADAVLHFLIRLDGRPGATASAVVSERGLLLFGGATAPWARGRGLYRALIRARWDEAERRGTPALVVQANPSTSAPILRRVGFVDVCRQRRLEDARRA